MGNPYGTFDEAGDGNGVKEPPRHFSTLLQDNQPIDKIILWTGISKDSIKKLAFG